MIFFCENIHKPTDMPFPQNSSSTGLSSLFLICKSQVQVQVQCNAEGGVVSSSRCPDRNTRRRRTQRHTEHRLHSAQCTVDMLYTVHQRILFSDRNIQTMLSSTQSLLIVYGHTVQCKPKTVQNKFNTKVIIF